MSLKKNSLTVFWALFLSQAPSQGGVGESILWGNRYDNIKSIFCTLSTLMTFTSLPFPIIAQQGRQTNQTKPNQSLEGIVMKILYPFSMYFYINQWSDSKSYYWMWTLEQYIKYVFVPIDNSYVSAIQTVINNFFSY